MKNKATGWVILILVFIIPTGICTYFSWEPEFHPVPPSVRYAASPINAANQQLLRELRQVNDKLDDIEQRQRDAETKARRAR